MYKFDEMIHEPEDQANLTLERPKNVPFLLTNRANPGSPALETCWSSLNPSTLLPADSPRPTLSDGLGLQHIAMAANYCGMIAELWQEEAQVCFQLSFRTTTAPPIATPIVQSSTVTPLVKSVPFSPGLNILVLDDSGIARKSLQTNLQKAAPDSTVAVYGKDAAEIQAFKQDAQTKGDILIMDENTKHCRAPIT